MDKKVVWVFLFVSLVIGSLVTGTQVVSAGSNDGMGFSSGVYLYSPINTTYASRFLTLNLTFGAGLGVQCSLNYSIDGVYNGPIPIVPKNNEMHVVIQTTGIVQLPELSEGSHCLTIYVEGDLTGIHSANPPGAPFQPTNAEGTNYAARWMHVIYFTIDPNAQTPASTAPTIVIRSPQNNSTYTPTALPLTFTLNEQATTITYCLDGNKTTILAENTTLAELSSGEHNLTVTAKDAAGNMGTSQTIQFTITTPTPTPLPPTSEPAQATLPSTETVAIALAIIAVGICVGIFVYLGVRKRKDPTSSLP